MEAVAKLNKVPMSARKARLVIDNIRGREVNDALNILRFTRKEAATWIEKNLLSAIANWEQKAGVSNSDEYELYVKECYANQGAMLKRFRPAPYGRAHRIRKHSCHIYIQLENRVELEAEAEDFEDFEINEEVIEEVTESVD
ncbi:MAG: 50S ribosomal protein L22 [Saprospiraceae bacterium]